MWRPSWGWGRVSAGHPTSPRSADWVVAAQPGRDSPGHWPEWELLERVLGSQQRDPDIAGSGRVLDVSPGGHRRQIRIRVSSSRHPALPSMVVGPVGTCQPPTLVLMGGRSHLLVAMALASEDRKHEPLIWPDAGICTLGASGGPQSRSTPLKPMSPRGSLLSLQLLQ